MEFLVQSESEGLYQTILPWFDNDRWPDILAPNGFVWIDIPFAAHAQSLCPVIAKELFGDVANDVRCSIHRLEFDVSLPVADFLATVDSNFGDALDLICSEKHQPSGLRLREVPKAKWPELMLRNQIYLVFHRPGGGEPSLVISNKQQVIEDLIKKFSS